MTKEEQLGIDWYDLWKKQSKIFFATAEENLKDFFAKNKWDHPEEHLDLIKAWMDNFKKQWSFSKLAPEQEAHANYWQVLMQLSVEACDLLQQEWMKRSKNNQPIKTIQELYELWLQCCSQVYQNSLQSNRYQEMYAEFMKAAMKFWKPPSSS